MTRVEDRQWTRERLVLWSGAALFLTVLSPFGTDSDLSFLQRPIYWFGVIFGGGAMVLAAAKVFDRLTTFLKGEGLHRPFVIPAQIAAASIPITLLVASMETWLREPLPLAQLPVVFAYVLTITASVTTVAHLVERNRALREKIEENVPVSGASEQFETSCVTTQFHLRLDPRLRQSEILWLKAEDHYLRVETSAGAALIRCTLAAAIEELGSAEGRQVHRSYWVARSAISKIRKHGRGYRLVTTAGTTIPLSRSRYRELSKIAWFKPSNRERRCHRG